MRVSAFALLGVLAAAPAFAQAPAAPLAASKPCTITRPEPSEALTFLQKGEFTKAEPILQTEYDSSKSVSASYSLVRALLGHDKLAEGFALADATQKAHPQDALAILSLGEARYRRGEVDLAAPLIIQAEKSDPCLARAHLALGRYLDATGLFATAEKQFAEAYRLSPTDIQIRNTYAGSNPLHLRPDAQIAQYKTWADEPGLAEDDKKKLTRQIHTIEIAKHGRCRLVQQPAHLVIPLTKKDDVRERAAFLEVKLNGHKNVIQLDTGVTGLLLPRRMAEAAGLKKELETAVGGIGDKGQQKAYLAVVEDLRIGTLQFKQCPVEVVESDFPFALIGADVFSKFLVTIDIPSNTMALDPLPERPGTAAAAALEANPATAEDAANEPIDEHLEDRYVSPQQQDWQQVLRIGHTLLAPTQLNNGPVKLMMLETGAGINLLFTPSAKEVSKLSVSEREIRGLSGEVKHPQKALNLHMRFLDLQITVDEITVVDSPGISRNLGLEVAGLIGFTVLRELKIEIDYRDNLVKITYDPSKGHHPQIHPGGTRY